MGIRRKIFWLLTAIVLTLLTFSYIMSYTYFYDSILEETVVKQQAYVEINRQLADSFIQSVHQTAMHLVSDKALGELLSVEEKDMLKLIQTRESIKTQFSHYATQQVADGDYTYRSTFFLSDLLPVAAILEDYTLDTNPYGSSSNVFSNSKAKEEEWYKKTAADNFYVFMNEKSDEFCIAKKIRNSYYVRQFQPGGEGILVVGVKRDQLEKVFLGVPITENSGYAIMDENGGVLYLSDAGNRAELYEKALDDYHRYGETQFTMKDQKGAYLITYNQTKYGIEFIYLTPYGDITKGVGKKLRFFIIFYPCVLVAALFLFWLLSGKISHPVVDMAVAIGKIKDTRNFDKNTLHVSNDREIVMLEKSFVSLIDNANRLIEDIQVQGEQRKRSELRALQAQINPHFIFNAMDMVNWMALSRNCDDIANVVSSIADLMRYSITDAEDMVTVEQEYTNIRKYVSLYRLRHEGKMELRLDVCEEGILIPKFTLQPLVENAVRYAKPEEGNLLAVSIRAYRKDRMVRIEVEDNGTGCAAAILNRHINNEETELAVSNGFGIRNVNERIRLRFSKKGGLSYQNTERGGLIAQIVFEELKKL